MNLLIFFDGFNLPSKVPAPAPHIRGDASLWVWAPESWNQPGTRRAPVLRELAGLTIKRLQDRQNIDLRIVDRLQDFTVELVSQSTKR
ncbi:hypothetical protein [Bradyrhizobium sp. 15]|uniref:hypothetical protein n=1 Tax=Bradyrhizobium sp. 15 TaxID=2782633 RepID=UPI001FF886F2|nr:hypothetical protein [Bradyrhizobium sp. 15]MCK1437551.1 hypothetical protein [Bradyrhizobium sp. 15]